jgi:hypothetical protein
MADSYFWIWSWQLDNSDAPAICIVAIRVRPGRPPRRGCVSDLRIVLTGYQGDA